MNGERPQVNGQHVLNGATSTQHHQATEAKISRIERPGPNLKSTGTYDPEPHENGVLAHSPAPMGETNLTNGLAPAPLEILQLVGKEHYLPMSSMISRTAQNCWNDLSALVDQLSTISVPQQSQDPSRPSFGLANNQTKANLDKKDRILNFADNHKAVFIKLLVLLQWSKHGDDVSKTVNLNFWLQNRRSIYLQARDTLAILKGDAPNFQIPNPDLATAGEVLSLGKSASFPDIGYHVKKPLKPKQILSSIRRLSRIVSVRLALEEALPPQLQTYHVQNGRATFVVAGEFEVDLSVLDESPNAPFRIIDFRFMFSPQPIISEIRRQEIEFIANSVIEQDGLMGCYDFFHSLTLTTQLTECYNQALQLSRNQWAGYLRIEILRRDLVVEYWRGNEFKKSWIEISVHSGRTAESTSESSPQSQLQVRWFREGKQVTELDLEMDLAHIEFESILLQIVARHANHILDSVYGRLITIDLFREEGLVVEQSSCVFDPKDCSLKIQLAKHADVTLSIDGVTGSIMVSPASDRTNRLQADLNRANAKAEDFVPRLLNHRCALAEDSFLHGMTDTHWERLDALKPSLADLRTLFGLSIVTANFFRHRLWTREYSIAITHSLISDKVWILHNLNRGHAASLADFRTLHDQSLGINDVPSTLFFDSFADYASGVVVLHSNAAHLQKLSFRHRLPRLSGFKENYHLPALAFEIHLGNSLGQVQAIGQVKANMETTKSSSAFASDVRLFYENVNPVSKLASLSVELRCNMESSVLESLSASNPDANINFEPGTGKVWLGVQAPVGDVAVDEIVQRVKRLNDVIACIRTVQGLSSMKLVSASMNALTIAHNLSSNQDSHIVVRFPTITEPPRLDFSIPGTDPQECLVPQLSQLLADRQQSFSTNVSSALLSLNLSRALITTLDDLQHAKIDGEVGPDTSEIRLHVIVRTPTMFALQFFSCASKGLVDNPTAARHERLLARFEILPSVRHERQWLIRPAIEEVNAYTRASFAAQSLRDRVREEVFAKRGPCPGWIRLDSAAVFLKDKPQPILHALHGLLVDWTKNNPARVEALPTPVPLPPTKDTSQQQGQPKPANPNVNGNANNRKASGPPHKAQANTSAQQRGKNPPKKGGQQPQKKQEVITLD